MSLDIDGLAKNSIVLIGEKTSTSVLWGKQFDGAQLTIGASGSSYTEGQFRALYLRIRRLMQSPNFEYNKVFAIGDNEDLVVTEHHLLDRTLLFAMLLRKKEYTFNDALIQTVITVASRAGIYTAKKFHSEIFEALERQKSQPLEEISFEQFTPQEALIHLETKDSSSASKELLAIIISTLTSEDNPNKNYLHSKPVFDAVMNMLSKIKDDDDPDITLDVAHVMAMKYKSVANFQFAKDTFLKIAEYAQKFERLALEIACRIQIADILKNLPDTDPSEIINTLITIDDGSLEVASPFDREVYYCMHGYAYNKMDDSQSAEDYYLMATMIAEMEGPNSIHIAEAHAYIAKMHNKKFEVDNAIREYVTASSIAQSNNEPDLAVNYMHQAGLSELSWAKMLASTSMVLRIEGDIQDSQHYAWKSLKHLLKGTMYTNRKLRKEDLDVHFPQIIDMCEEVLMQTYDEYSQQTINQIRENYNLFSTAAMPKIQEDELLKFLLTKVSAKLPLPNPIIMIIATDGRLIQGGEVGKDNWETALGANDDLFSGALSAIMAILSEVISTSNPLRMVDAGSTSIMIEKSDSCIGALLIDRDDIILRRALKDVLMQIGIKYPGLKDGWDGYSIDFSDMKPMINKRFHEAMAELSRD
ncbi:MAG: hypothetical protein INQ03_12230 [Candidatus Heimdallarchaeota archaeon]|nr:hypothetical protein [Candidatus Heimdallarchaeota archaeon]